MDVDLGGGQRLSLRSVDPSALNAAGRIDAQVALQRLRSWVDAQEQVVLAATAEPGDPPAAAAPGSTAWDKQYVREEIACALRISPLTVNARLHVARELTGRLPATLALLGAGGLTMRAARFLAESVTPLPDAVATRVERRVLERAATQTFPNFRACVQRAVLALDPRGVEDRHDAAVARRRVESRAVEDGMGSLHAELRADDLAALLASVQACADALPARGYPAGPHAADQRRADALVLLTTGNPAGAADGGDTQSGSAGGDGVDETTGSPAGAGGVTSCPPGNGSGGANPAGCGGASPDGCGGASPDGGGNIGGGGVVVRPIGRRHGRRPGVQISVALSTLLGVDDEPGELDGHGPIPACLARRIAADPTGTWRRLVTDPIGRLVDYGRTVYKPPQDLTDHVITRDRTCRFPGCRRQAIRCDLDHQTDWGDGGPTNDRNLQSLCARHHALKHDTGWTVTGDPNGTLTWTSPTGHVYPSPPGEHPVDTTMQTSDGIDETGVPDASRRPEGKQDDEAA